MTVGDSRWKFEQFSPEKIYRELAGAHPATWERLQRELSAYDAETLRERNAHWFAEPFGLKNAVATVWLINREFTRRGIAPRWRRIPEFLSGRGPPPSKGTAPGGRPIGEKLRGTVLKRWIDLEWLRAVLGPRHVTYFKTWQPAFDEDWDRAVKGFARVNAITSVANTPRVRPAYKVAFGLAIPALEKKTLMGLIDRDAGELVTNALKRVRVTIRPRMEALMQRPRFPLTREEVERRLTICEAIELAGGSPSDAAALLGWMTGEAISRQSLHEMKTKVAVQCNLRTRAWVAQR
jgi:hypothetical protein